MAEANNTTSIGSGSGSPTERATQTDDQCWNANRLEILGWLQRNAPSLAELYEGAVHLFCRRNIPGWTRMLCHVVREIGNELPDVITGIDSGMIVQHTSRLDQIVSTWRSNGLPSDGSLPGIQVTESEAMPQTTSVELPHEVYSAIANLIRDHVQTRQTREEAAIRMFEVLIPEQKNRDEFRPMIRQWRRAIQWFVSNAHDSEWLDAELDIPDLEKQFDLFEAPLAVALRQFFVTSKDIDDILKSANS